LELWCLIIRCPVKERHVSTVDFGPRSRGDLQGYVVAMLNAQELLSVNAPFDHVVGQEERRSEAVAEQLFGATCAGKTAWTAIRLTGVKERVSQLMCDSEAEAMSRYLGSLGGRSRLPTIERRRIN
jgi:hypothetical protein